MAIGTTFTLGFNGAAVQRGLASIGGRLQKLAGGALKNITAGFVAMGAAIGAAAVAGLGLLAKTASESASDMENLNAQFALFTGGAENAKKMLDELRVIATKSPLEMTDIAAGAKNLLVYGVAAEKVTKITNQLSEVSAGNGEVMGRLTYAFGQITSIGRLMGTELRQLTEAGFNPLEFISKKTGESMIQLKKRMEDGGVSLQEVEEALTAATSAGGRFYGLNEKMSQTFSGRVSMMKDQWVQLTAAMGDGMNRGLKIAIDAVTNGLPKFKEQFMAIGNVIGDAIGEAVAGDMGKLTAIGDLIGSTIAAAATAAFQAGSTGLVAGAENLARGGIRKGIAVVAGEQTAESVLPNMQGASFKELLDAALINRGIQEKAAAIMGNGPQTYIPSASSPAAVEEFNQRRVEMIDERMSRQSPPWIQEILKQNELQRQMLDELKKANKEGSKL